MTKQIFAQATPPSDAGDAGLSIKVGRFVKPIYPSEHSTEDATTVRQSRFVSDWTTKMASFYLLHVYGFQDSNEQRYRPK